MTEYSPGDLVEILSYGNSNMSEPYPRAEIVGQAATLYIQVRTTDDRLFWAHSLANCLPSEIRPFNPRASLRRIWSQT